ncbi:hypothetical protein PHYBOEH_009310 [Phytophthora boehmeriae]|uniref:Uncharacterized protein n=1 Tax=Phytophthora boehmeriae TaxID=109152 RepID=A0A8T1VTR3_9STRA|nr:hypothetical protein PHYBOEH_009310 [Phytophthora boehmeriae]
MAALAEVQELVTKYRAAATANGSDDSSPVLLTRKGFGVASGKSWPLSPSEFWLRLHLVTRISASDKRQQSVAQQLRHRRALMELLSQLSSTPSCRWVEAFESLWWPSVLRPANFKDGFSVGGLQREIGETPKFALAVNRPTLESVEWLFQFIRTDCRDALHSEDWELLRTLKTEDRQQKIELCLDMSSNIIRTSVLRSLVDNLQDYFDVARDSRALKNEDESLRIEYEVTALWTGDCQKEKAAKNVHCLQLNDFSFVFSMVQRLRLWMGRQECRKA